MSEWFSRQLERLFLVALIFTAAFLVVRECQWWTTYRHAAEIKMRAIEVMVQTTRPQDGAQPTPYRREQ